MTDLLEYKCPNCGGKIEFNATSQKMKCPFCKSEFELESLKAYDEALKDEKKDKMEWKSADEQTFSADETKGMRVYTCESCGGEIIADENTAASSCPFCGNPVVMKGQFIGELKPDFVIPFKLDKNAAKEALKRHYLGKKLLPKVFTSQNHIDEIKGIYVPFWLFNADAYGSIRYDATRTRAYSDSNYDYLETSHFMVTRQGDVQFANIPVDGDTKLDDTMMQSIEPFDWNDCVDFQTAYLSGYFADKYDVDMNASIETANERAKASVQQALARTVTGYTSVVPTGGYINLSNGTVHYALLPVWMLTTSWNGKKYSFAMNAQTGKLIGDLPIDKKIYWRNFSIFGAGSAIIAFAVMYLMSVL